MTTHATITFEIKDWQEQPYDDMGEAAKITKARVLQTYQGDLEGEGVAESLMTYPDDTSASYVWQERVVGTLGGRTGAFVLQGSGTYRDGTARTRLTVVPGSGTGAVRGLRGEGVMEAAEGRTGTVTLDYDLPRVDRS